MKYKLSALSFTWPSSHQAIIRASTCAILALQTACFVLFTQLCVSLMAAETRTTESSQLRSGSIVVSNLAITIDGGLTEADWQRAESIRGFTFPWSQRAAPDTEFRALADAERLYFAFAVSDDDVVVEREFADESTLDREDRVEIFFARDAALERYFCLEIDPLGHVHDYAASHYRKFDNAWKCAGLQTAGRIGDRGYTVEASIPLKTLTELLGHPVAAGTMLRVGFFRAEFRKGALGDADDNWLCWTKPATPTPDFHVPSAFADWRVPAVAFVSASVFKTRGVVLVPEDLSLADWPERAAKAGLTTIALHHGASPKGVVDFIESPAGHQFLQQCARLGLQVEYELHAMRELLPRSLFATEPALFRMNDKGQRTADANLCVHSARALETVSTNALRLARQLQPTTGRYFFWGDDGLPWCRCAQCREFSDSDQALLLENHLVRELRKLEPRAQLAHLAYANTLAAPTRVKPEPDVFLEFAPIGRRYDLPYAQQSGPEAKDKLQLLEQNLRVFPAETAQALEYWLDVSRFSGWKRPDVKLPWRRDVVAADAETYARLGLRHLTTFAVWIDADYVKRFGEPTAVQEYGETLRGRDATNREAVTATNLTPVTIPPPVQILVSLRREHPRLLATAQDFARLRAQVRSDPQLNKWHGQLAEQAKKILSDAPSRYEIPDGLRLLATSRRVLHRVQTLALLYRLDDDGRYAERAWRELETAANFKDWNPRHFLDTAEMTHAFAIGYDWLYDVWTDGRRATLRNAMVEKGIKPALKIHEERRWWAVARHNWNQVCNGGIGMGALAAADVEPELAGEFLCAALQSIQLPMAEFAPDGAWAEGPGYWNYATTYNVVFLAALQTALGTDFGLSRMPGFAEAGLFPIYATGPFGRTFNYADAGDGAIRAPQMLWMARQFNRPVCAAYQLPLALPDPLDLIWFNPHGEQAALASLPLDKYFRQAEVITLRSAWDDRDALFVGFKAGDNKANHSHLDIGGFVLDALGVRWGVDLGADDYNLPGYFGGQRWSYYRLRAEGHNTLVINPGTEADQDPSAAAKIVKYESKPERALAVADLTAGYAKNARKVTRGIALLDRKQVLVQDEIATENPAEVWWFLHTPATVRVSQDGTIATLTQGKARLMARILAPAEAGFKVMDAAPLPTSPHPEKQNANAKVRKLAIQLKDVEDVRLAVLLTPVRDEEKVATTLPRITPLANW